VADSEELQPAEAAPNSPREPWFGPYRGLPFRISLKWLGAGVLVYALLLMVAIAGNPQDAMLPIFGPSLYLTPMFGLPLLFVTVHRPGRARRLVYFLALLPLIHIAANYLAWSHAVANHTPFDASGDFERNLIAGALGGFTGAALSFSALHLIGLTARRRAELAPILLATLALTALAAAGMALGLQWTDATRDARHEAGRLIIWYEAVHLPWQLVFALALAWLMRRPRRARRAKAPLVTTV
jgi:hypothetical protein